MPKSLLAVATGYVIFAGSAAALAVVTGIDPHQVSSPRVAAALTGYGLFFALFAGVVVSSLSPHSPALHARLVAAFIALIAVGSAGIQFGKGAIWSEVATVVLMAPSVLLGEWITTRLRL